MLIRGFRRDGPAQIVRIDAAFEWQVRHCIRKKQIGIHAAPLCSVTCVMMCSLPRITSRPLCGQIVRFGGAAGKDNLFGGGAMIRRVVPGTSTGSSVASRRVHGWPRCRLANTRRKWLPTGPPASSRGIHLAADRHFLAWPHPYALQDVAKYVHCARQSAQRGGKPQPPRFNHFRLFPAETVLVSPRLNQGM